MNLKTRHLQARLKTLGQHFKVILVTGSRQVGKSTLLKETFPHLPVITFDAHQDIYGAMENPDLFLKLNPAPLILDEVQYIPQLLASIKRKVDESPAMGQYFLTGSHHIGLMKGVVEGLTGRIGIIDLERMTVFEDNQSVRFEDEHQNPPTWLQVYLEQPMALIQNFAGLATPHPLAEIIWRGGLPVAQEKPLIVVSDYLSSYITSYLQRDVLYIDPTAASPLFTKFLGAMTARTAQEIHAEDIMQTIGIKRDTFLQWEHLLQKTYQWRELPAYSGNCLKRLVKRGKGHCTDTGLAAHLQGISSPQALAVSPAVGPLFESLCVSTLFGMMSSLYQRPKVYHWRTYAGAEVDIVLEMNGKLYPIETKFGTTLSKHDTRGITAFRETYGDQVAHGLILYPGDYAYALSEHVTVLPFNALMKRKL